MSMNHVKIYYGPCESFHTVTHKPQKLRGLVGNFHPKSSLKSDYTCDIIQDIDRLQKLGFRVEMAPVEFINYCVLEMCGHEVFRCNIQNLRFNTPYNLDLVCQRAINAVIEGSAKFKRARLYLWFWTLIEGQILTRSKYGPKDHWPSQLELKLEKFANCMDCLKCCGILAVKK